MPSLWNRNHKRGCLTVKCPKCGLKVPDDSDFCQYCGVSLEEYLVSNEAPTLDDAPESQNTEQGTESKRDLHQLPLRNGIEGTPHSAVPAQIHHCKKCGGEIDNATKQCKSCGKQYFSFKKALPTIILTVFLVGFGALNVVQFLYSQSLKAEIDGKSEIISAQKSTISRREAKISELETKADAYDAMIDALSNGNLGYAASNFNVSESVVVVSKNQTDRKVTLTAYWYDGGVVSLSYSPSYSRSASVSFDEESWDRTTKLSITPKKEGVTTVTFSNDQDSNTFKMIIIVTD